jgi:hypothetical protein
MSKKQKTTTKNGSLTTTDTNRRSSSKYPALDKRKNLPSRQDLIDFDYLGKLSDKELTFLNNFVEETVVTNFAHHKLIKGLQSKKKRIIEDETVQDLKSKVEALKAQYGENTPEIKQLMLVIRDLKKQNEETYYDDIEGIESELTALREQFLLYPDKEDHKVFYSENNARNMCLLNKKKLERRLDELLPDKYDEFADEAMYEDDAEEELINRLERAKWEEEEDRLASVFQDEKKTRRSPKA